MNTTYKIENIEGPASVQRRGVLLELQDLSQDQKKHLSGKGADNMVKVTTPRPPLDLQSVFGADGFSPHGALFLWVHSRPWFAVISRGKLSRVRKRTNHSDGAGTVHAANIIFR